MRISDWSSDVCSSDLALAVDERQQRPREGCVGLRRQLSRKRRQRLLPRRVDRGTMVGKLRLQTRQPLRVGARLVGKQLSARAPGGFRSAEPTSELQTTMPISSAVLCLTTKTSHVFITPL